MGDIAKNPDKSVNEPPTEKPFSKIGRAGLQAAGGAIPLFGGLLSAAAGAWGEHAQGKMNDFLLQIIKMLQEEMEEKYQTMGEIAARLDLQDEKIQARVSSEEYRSLVRKAFREWSGTESEAKRVFIRNILSNAAASELTSDDVVRLFIEWIGKYSELHFTVIAAIYNENGISRGAIWDKIGKGKVREDSAEADLYKTLFHDLQTGHIVRQHRATTYDGRFIKQQPNRQKKGNGDPYHKSAFDYEKPYELTALGEQFVHYAMSDIPPKLEYQPAGEAK